MSKQKAVGNEYLAIFFLMFIVVIIALFKYSNIANVPLEFAFESAKYTFCSFVVIYILLWLLAHSTRSLKALIPAIMIGAMPIIGYHWEAFAEYAIFYRAGVMFVIMGTLTFWDN